jgi:hypothetical protein
MPRIVPSQVVAAIDGLFGASRNELNGGMIGIALRDNVRTLLSLLRQVPDELITVPFADYTVYLQCQSSLTSALSVWDVADRGPPVRNISGKDPVERIRRILAVCPIPILPSYPTTLPERMSSKTYELPGLISGLRSGRAQPYLPPPP